MDPCHTKPFVKPGIAIGASPRDANTEGRRQVFAEPEDMSGATCDYCGSDALEWRKCKLICNNCRQINKSCADL